LSNVTIPPCPRAQPAPGDDLTERMWGEEKYRLLLAEMDARIADLGEQLRDRDT
jgi:hypothetical protein